MKVKRMLTGCGGAINFAATLILIVCAVLSSAIAQPSIFAGAGVTGGPRVQGRNVAANYAPNFDQFAYEDTFRGGTSVAFGDVDSDGVPDLITGPGDGGGPRLRVFSGRCLRNNQICGMADLFVGDPNYRGGITVASCDVDKDGFADVVIGQNQYVAVISGERLRVGVYAKMFEQSGFPGQVGTETPVACGDFNGDGYGDIANSMGNGNGPVVRVYNGERARFNQTNQVFYQFVFDPGDRFPVHLAAGDVNGDGRADLAVSAGIGGAPRVRIMNGQPLFSNQLSVFYDNYVLDPNTRGGVFVGIADLIADGKADLLIGAGAQAGGYVRVFDGAAASGNGSVDRGTYQPYEPNFVGGIWVAGADLTLPQCSDGIDNDGDGAVDLNDFSCLGNIKKNDEFRPFSQCYDGQDNDNDGLVDTDDPGCGGNRQNNNEGAATSQCQDGADNDGDGAVDLADFSCLGDRRRNDEGNPRSACQDGIDNDGDGAVDLGDFSCLGDRQRNDETNPRAQCQDGLDNDGDGAVDLNDFSCQGNPQKNDEANPKSQCQDGIDNDGDGFFDYRTGGDYSCGSLQDNDETFPKTQCQDGADNDGDGLIDMQDPGCVSTQDNDEGDGTSQCQDGRDNDGDGAIDFPADFSCSSRQDNDETNPRAQCQDGVDNDGDGLIDLQDPGCANLQDNNEGDATAQCQDGVDNDGDGARDYPADFSCSSATDNDETNPRAQCQDGADNDGDGLIDLQDPGCSSPQDNNEGDGTSQCQDGRDNDGDGAIDFPADFSCSNRQDNDETNPKAQCQDGADNDSDGLIDLQDPGCSSSQDNNEGDGTTQCQDGIDNDADGAIDFPADFSCSSRQDNDETNPKAQCQDGLDNDSDGAIDLADFSCGGNRQKNDESSPRSQCQDGVDNDADGKVDLADPGCGNNSQNNNEANDGPTPTPTPTRTTTPTPTPTPTPVVTAAVLPECSDGRDNDGDGFIDLNDPDCNDANDPIEAGTGPSILPIVECVQNNKNGTYTAYFGYESTLSSTTTVPTGIVATNGERTFNVVQPAPASQRTITSFEVGRKRGVNPVVFSTDNVTWIIRPFGGQGKSATASKTSPACQAVQPTVACADPVAGGQSLAVNFGYQNPNLFDVTLAIGDLNKFSPLPIDRGQPTAFFAGTVTTALQKVQATVGTTWTLVDKLVAVTSQLPACTRGCTNVVSENVKADLDAVALQLADLTVKAADNLVKVVKTSAVKKDAERAKKRAADFVVEANSLTIKFPSISQTCADAPPQCRQVDNSVTIGRLKGLYAQQRSAVQRFVARANFRLSGSTIRNLPIVVSAKNALAKGVTSLNAMPRFQVDCTNQ